MAEWLCICKKELKTSVISTMQAIDPNAHMEFVASPEYFRRCVDESAFGEYGAVVAPFAGEISQINLCGVLMEQSSLRELVMLVEYLDENTSFVAHRAGIVQVRQLSGGEERSYGSGDFLLTNGVYAKKEQSAISPARNEGIKIATETIVQNPFGTPQSAAPVLVFCSGRGGVGKTSLAALSAVHAAMWGIKVKLLDLDLSYGNLYSFFGLPQGLDLDRYCKSDAQVEFPQEGLCPNDAYPLWIYGPCSKPEMSEEVFEHIPLLLDSVCKSADLVIVDTSTTFTDGVAEAVQHADRVLIVSDEPYDISSSSARCASLVIRLGVARTRIIRVRNRLDPKERFDIRPKENDSGFDAARIERVFEGGVQAEEYVSMGQVSLLAASGSDYSKSTQSMLAHILEELGCLPDIEDAKAAAKRKIQKNTKSFLSFLREAK